MKIYGHPLPEKLYQIIKDKEPDELPILTISMLRRVVPADVQIGGGAVGGLRVNNLAGIKRESAPYRLIDKQINELYGIDSSKNTGKPITKLSILDVDKSLFIAGNHDEETIALDYRNNPQIPCVRGSFISNIAEWILLADTFTEFAIKVGLLEER
ncbi:MAG: hypothetical protein AAFR81_02005 [Chloroflexota bacterium]